MTDNLYIKVKSWLKANEMNQKELASMLGISSPYLSDILLDKRKGKKVREKIEQIIGIKGAS